MQPLASFEAGYLPSASPAAQQLHSLLIGVTFPAVAVGILSGDTRLATCSPAPATGGAMIGICLSTEDSVSSDTERRDCVYHLVSSLCDV